MIKNILRHLIENNKFLIDKNSVHQLSYMKLNGRRDKTGMVSFLIFDRISGIPKFYIRIPRNPHFFNFLKQEYNSLLYLQKQLGNTPIEDTFSAPILFEKICDHHVLITTAKQGKPMFMRIQDSILARKKRLREYIEISFEWLNTFHSSTAKRGEILDINNFKKYIEDPLLKFQKMRVGENSDYLFLLIDKMKSYLGDSLFISACHGDFSPYNILISNNKIGIIDWEDFEKKAISLRDVFQFFTATTFVLSPDDYKLELGFSKLFFDCTWYQDLFYETLSKYCSANEISIQFANSYFPIYLITMINKELNPQRGNKSKADFWTRILKIYVEKKFGFK